jgi:hypothetical protein
MRQEGEAASQEVPGALDARRSTLDPRKMRQRPPVPPKKRI